MLVGFSVSNYKSFKDTQSISFIASKISRHKDHIQKKGNRKLLKSGLIFGANAGGKSNLISAVDFSTKIILSGVETVDLSKKYFRIESNAYNQPGIFEYRIIVKDTEYSFGIAISYENREIIGEWLVKIGNNGNETYIYNREINDRGESCIESEFEYDSQEERTRMEIYKEDFGTDISETLRKKTFLSDIAQRMNGKQGMFSDIVNVYDWFKNVVIIFPSSKYQGLNDAVADEKKRKLFSKVMSAFDTGIESVEGQEQEMDLDKILQPLSKEDAEKAKIDITNATSEHPIMFKIRSQYYILRKDRQGNIVYNKLLSNHGNPDDLFEYMDESDGTRRLFDLVPLFYENRRKSVIFIDEIDRSLHTNLTKRYLEFFYRLMDHSSCQLIATTHDSNLLDLELLRQDEIWFVERQEDHSSRIYSLNKYRERFDKRIDKEYLLGRYGAIPLFDEVKLDSEDAYEE